MRTAHSRARQTPRARSVLRVPGRRLVVLAAALVALLPAGALAAAPASFRASDPLLGTIWAQSAKTAGLMLSAPTNLGAGCSYPAGHTVILDGNVRDRCAWIGDLAVTGKTLLLTGQGDPADLRFELQAFADTQRDDGSICPVLGLLCEGLTLVDYQAYWIEALRDYVLYTGDLGAARALLGSVTSILDRYYPAGTVDGLFRNELGPADYAYVNRRSPVVAYYNARYAVALREGAELARWADAPAAAAAWEARAATLAQGISRLFWDMSAGAFRDTPDAAVVHAQDGNAFAVLAGAGSAAQRRSALDYLAAHNAYDYGNSISDADAWDGWPWGDGSRQRAYPFISFFEVQARFREGLDASAIELIRREWGYMARVGPGTTWEVIGPFGSPNVFAAPSFAHGWSSGAAPALTSYVLGVQPDGPGFPRFVARPHTGKLAWAAGDVPTPRGTIHFEWRRQGKRFTARVVSPVPGTVVLPAVGLATVDGRKVSPPKTPGATTVRVKAGTHAIVVGPPVKVKRKP